MKAAIALIVITILLAGTCIFIAFSWQATSDKLTSTQQDISILNSSRDSLRIQLALSQSDALGFKAERDTLKNLYNTLLLHYQENEHAYNQLSIKYGNALTKITNLKNKYSSKIQKLGTQHRQELYEKDLEIYLLTKAKNTMWSNLNELFYDYKQMYDCYQCEKDRSWLYRLIGRNPCLKPPTFNMALKIS